MKCPKDKSILIAEKAEAHTGYGCASCKGSWLPKSYIDSIQYTKEFDPKDFYNSLSNQDSKKQDMICPVNCGSLSTLPLLKGVSYCQSCLGLWFEPNTLKTMLNSHRNKGESAAFVDSGNVAIGVFDIIANLIK